MVFAVFTPLFLPNDIISTPSVHADPSSYLVYGMYYNM